MMQCFSFDDDKSTVVNLYGIDAYWINGQSNEHTDIGMIICGLTVNIHCTTESFKKFKKEYARNFAI